MYFRSVSNELEQWRVSSNRKPLIIRGARQVGKSTVVSSFGKQFKQFICLDLKKQSDRELFKGDLDINDLVDRIFLVNGLKRSLIHDTLVFIDEIQEDLNVFNLLVFFKEVSGLSVIAAGNIHESILGKRLTLNTEDIDVIVLRPFSFYEFLQAFEKEDILKQLNHVPLRPFALETCLKMFHIYALIGGMPEVVKKYVETRDLTSLGEIYEKLFDLYLVDAEKYTKNEVQLQLVRYCINHLILNTGKRVNYTKFGDNEYKSYEISKGLSLLQNTYLIDLMHPVVGFDINLNQDFKKSPRLHFLDSGMMSYFAGVQKDLIGVKDLNSILNGVLIEHLVGQELFTLQKYGIQQVSFWTREKNQSQAEIDFVYPFEGELIPIEVKPGSLGKLKSLQLFMESSKINYAIRFYAGKLKVDTTLTPSGKVFYLLSLPYFLVGKIEQYVLWIKEYVNNLQETIQGEEGSLNLKEKNENKRPKEVPVNSMYELTNIHKDILRFCMDEPRKGKEIIEGMLNLTYQSRNKTIYLKPLIELGLLAFTDLNYLKSKQQKYKTTNTGIEFINERQLSLF